MPSSSDFFDIVNAFTRLYVSYRGRYVVAINGHMYIPHVNDKECKKLDNTAIIGHLNQKYAIGVFAALIGSPFICFDVDLADKDVVRSVIDGINEFGIPRDYIHVSTSGGKGFHVEVFFTGLVFTNLLHDLYTYVIEHKNLDPKKVEFRPTFGQAIKLPLSKHHKTGRVCWYLDRETLEPIEDIGYVLSIQRMERDLVEKMIREKVKKSEEYIPPPVDPSIKESTTLSLEYGTLPMLTGPGMRYNTMKNIAVRERYKGTPQEEIESKLIEWAKEQNSDFITDPWTTVVKDAESLAGFVWRDGFVTKDRKLFISHADIENILSSVRTKLQRRIAFLILLYCRRYGAARLSAQRISRNTGCSLFACQKALGVLEAAGIIEKRNGKISYSDEKFVAAPNTYIYHLNKISELGGNIEVDWNFKEKTFVDTYLKVMSENVPRESWEKKFTKKEFEELTNYGRDKGGYCHE